MNRYRRAVGITLFLAATAVGTQVQADAPDASPPNVTDARQETQIWTTFALNPYLRANDLMVFVRDGKATLSGKVEEGVSKDLAKQIALGVSGIKEVDNRIEIDPGYVFPAPTSARTYGEIIDDATITTEVKSKLIWSKATSGLSTEVDTRSGKVTLYGNATSAAAKSASTQLAMSTRGVTGVDNQQVVTTAAPSAADDAKNAAYGAGQNLSDGWITTKVKSTYLYSRNVDGDRITVSTADGVVTLTGKLGSGAERALAIEFAKNIRGVKRVDSTGLTL